MQVHYLTKYKDECHTQYHKSCKAGIQLIITSVPANQTIGIIELSRQLNWILPYRRATQSSTSMKWRRNVMFIMKKVAMGELSILSSDGWLAWNYCRYGYHKKCHVYPREECHDIPIKHPVKVPLGKFVDGVVTILICSVFNWKDPWPLFHFKEECHDVPKTHCKKFPIQVSLTSLFYLKSFNFVQVPHESCKSVPDKHCIEESTSINLFSISPNIPSKIHFFATINYCPMEPIENKWK